MNRLKTLMQLTEVAIAALELKKRQVRPHIRRAVSRELNVRQAEAAERDVERALIPLFKRQVGRMIGKLESGKKKDLLDQKQATKELIDTIAPILAVRMAEAARNQLLALGVDVRRRRKFTKGDLPGHPFRGNQWDGGGAASDTGGGSSEDRQWMASWKRDNRTLSKQDTESGLLISKLTAIGGAAVSINEKSDEPDLNLLTGSRAATFTTQGRVVKIMAASQCHTNVSKLMKSGKIDAIATGWALPDDGLWRQHTWSLKSGKIMETTWKYQKYFGVKLNKAEAAAFMKSNLRKSFVEPEKKQPWQHLIESFSSTKTTTATDWLMEQEGDDLDELIEGLSRMFPDGTPFRLMTELPKPMQERIVKELRESFQQDYWGEIAATTAGDANRILERGLQEGWSIRDMANEMRESLGEEYYKNRSFNIARTESGNALNGARRGVMDQLQEDLGEKVAMRPVWLSVLGNTTRDTHAELDGVPADKNGMWDLAGYEIPWPGHISLPVGERANCRCSIFTEFGLRDDEAAGLIEDYYARQEEEAAVRGLVEKNGEDDGD